MTRVVGGVVVAGVEGGWWGSGIVAWPVLATTLSMQGSMSTCLHAVHCPPYGRTAAAGTADWSQDAADCNRPSTLLELMSGADNRS